MDENDLKKYTLIVGNGSGILFQPTDSNQTYVLSAKHVFYDKNSNDRGIDEKETLKSKINLSFSNSQSKTETFKIKKGENYFEHSNDEIDAAIFIINKNLKYNQIYADEKPSTFDGFNLTGFPESKRAILDKYNKYKIIELISSNEDILSLRLTITHLAHRDISGFSGGGIIKINKDSLIIAGIQSRTPIEECNGEIAVIPIKKFQEITEKNNLSQLLPSYLSKVTELIDDIIKLDDTTTDLKPKIKLVLRRQLNQVKLNLVNIYQSKFIEKSCTSKLNKKTKHFWTSFLEYALIISLIEENSLDEKALMKIIKEKKFMFSDSDKGIYEMFSDILLFASDDIEDGCQVLVGSIQVPKTKKTRRILTKDIPTNIASVDDFDNIDRVVKAQKIKELIHLKAIELDCINENDAKLNEFSIEEFEQLLKELKKIVNEFFRE
tara:strand:- start:4227 stop:5537 length:1311 start_codon:yes stop_codon:yes gene_type:complete